MIWYDIWYDMMIWYDMTWYDIRYDMIWYMTWHDMIWYDMIWYTIWYNMIWYDIRYDIIWYDMIYDTIWHDMMWYVFNCNWVETRWQKDSTHIHTNDIQNTENGTYITIKKIWKCGPCPVFASYTLTFVLQPRKMHGKPWVWVAARTSQADTVQCSLGSSTYITSRHSTMQFG
jgi:hypothetical protein